MGHAGHYVPITFTLAHQIGLTHFRLSPKRRKQKKKKQSTRPTISATIAVPVPGFSPKNQPRRSIWFRQYGNRRSSVAPSLGLCSCGWLVGGSFGRSVGWLVGRFDVVAKLFGIADVLGRGRCRSRCRGRWSQFKLMIFSTLDLW